MAGPAFVQPACQAIAAVASGTHTVAAFRVINQMPSFGRVALDTPTPPASTGDQQFSAPFGAGASAATIGWRCSATWRSSSDRGAPRTTP
jgi:hypothetical protein